MLKEISDDEHKNYKVTITFDYLRTIRRSGDDDMVLSDLDRLINYCRFHFANFREDVLKYDIIIFLIDFIKINERNLDKLTKAYTLLRHYCKLNSNKEELMVLYNFLITKLSVKESSKIYSLKLSCLCYITDENKCYKYAFDSDQNYLQKIYSLVVSSTKSSSMLCHFLYNIVSYDLGSEVLSMVFEFCIYLTRSPEKLSLIHKLLSIDNSLFLRYNNNSSFTNEIQNIIKYEKDENCFIICIKILIMLVNNNIIERINIDIILRRLELDNNDLNEHLFSLLTCLMDSSTSPNLSYKVLLLERNIISISYSIFESNINRFTLRREIIRFWISVTRYLNKAEVERHFNNDMITSIYHFLDEEFDETQMIFILKFLKVVTSYGFGSAYESLISTFKYDNYETLNSLMDHDNHNISSLALDIIDTIKAQNYVMNYE